MNIDLQTILHNQVAADRAEEMKTSEQLTLGELITKLEAVVPTWGNDKEEKVVEYDFEYAYPTTLDSWRGSYCELALGYDLGGCGLNGQHKFVDMKITKLIEHLKSALGKTFTGWKGGDFVMGKTTPVWVANPGNSGRTAIVDVYDSGTTVHLITKLMRDD